MQAPGPAFDREFNPVPGAVEQLSPLVRRVLAPNPGPFTFRGTATHIVGRGRVAVIDPGPEDETHLAALLAALDGETVSHILITHTHRDHSPLARRLKAATGAPVIAHGPHPASASGGLDASGDTDFEPDALISHGEAITGPGFTLTALHTPGHLSNHLAFALAEEQALFPGDHVMSWATTVVAPPEGNMGDYLASLRLLLAREDQIYWPAHGPGRRDPLPLVRGILTHRQMREGAILARLEAASMTVAEIVAANYAGLDPRLTAAAGLSTLAHLEHLAERGLARAVDGAGLAQRWELVRR